jgi:anti-sigma factor RsiW
MGCYEIHQALSEFVDGTLSREAKARLESHLEACADCRALLADLRRLREWARGLPKMAPPASVWQHVRADFEMETGRARRLTMAPPASGTSSPTLRQALVRRFVPTGRPVLAGLAVAAVLVLAASAGIFFMTRPVPPAAQVEPTAAHAEPAQTVQSVEAEIDLADQHYEKAIAGLEKVAKDGQAALDPQTAAVLQKNIGVIDQAIRESRAAIRSQPTSEVAQASLFEALQRKVGLLRDTIALINEMRKGDQAGTAKIMGSLGKS